METSAPLNLQQISCNGIVSLKTLLFHENAPNAIFLLAGDAKYIAVFVGFLVVVLGAAGNGVTVWAYTRNKNLQTSFNVLIANLCLVDLIFSSVVIPSLLPGYVVGVSTRSVLHNEK